MFRSKAITAETTPTLIVDPREGTAAVPIYYVLYNPAGATVVYLGGDDVTPANGIPLKPDSYVTIPLAARQQLYAIADTPTSIRVAGTKQEAIVS